MQIRKVEVQGILFVRITCKGETRDVTYERVQAKGLVQCLEDIDAPREMVKAAHAYAANGG